MEIRQMTRKLLANVALCNEVDFTESERKRVTSEVPHTSIAAVCWRVTCDQLVSDQTRYPNVLCKDIRDLLQEFLEKDPIVLRVLEIPQQLLSAEIRCTISSETILEIICRNPLSLFYIPAEVRSHDQYLTAVTSVTYDGLSLQYVPRDMCTEQICLAAVTRDGLALRYVPELRQTEWLCLAAVIQEGHALNYVPIDLRTEQLCLAAVTHNGRALQFVPEVLRTEWLCLTAVTQEGLALEYVPEVLRTEQLCLAAVTQRGWMLPFVPEHLRTEQLCLAAVTRDGLTLLYVPEQLKTKQLCLAAVKQDSLASEYVPIDPRGIDTNFFSLCNSFGLCKKTKIITRSVEQVPKRLAPIPLD